MSIVVVGLNHRSAPSDVLERVAIPAGELHEALGAVLKSPHIAEAVVVSTCLRTEIYVDAVRFHGAVGHVREVLARLGGVDRVELNDNVFEFFDDVAVAHLFKIASGIDSAVLGEGEVLGQIARAWATARDNGSARAVLNPLFSHAVKVGKRVRSETAIAKGVTSIGQAAVMMVTSRLGTLADKSVLLLGTGEMGRSMAATLSRAGTLRKLTVVNRTNERAIELAEQVQGVSVPYLDLLEALTEVDVLLTSTGASDAVLNADQIADVMRGRSTRPLVIVDMGVPHDVEASAAEVAGVTILDVESLQSFTAVGRASRENELTEVNELIDEEVRAYGQLMSARSVVPLVRDLRDRAEVVRLSEMERSARVLETLTPEQREAVEQLTRSLLNKLLHEPTIRLKDSAGSAEGDRLATAVRAFLDAE